MAYSSPGVVIVNVWVLLGFSPNFPQKLEKAIRIQLPVSVYPQLSLLKNLELVFHQKRLKQQ